MTEGSGSRVLYLVDESATAFVEQLVATALANPKTLPEELESGATAIRELLARVVALQYAGFTCEVARTSDDAVERVLEVSPKLIILDVVGYNTGTRRLQRDLKQHPATREIPLIILTNDGRKRLRFRAKAIGCESYLVRPALPALAEEVRRICSVGLELPESASL